MRAMERDYLSELVFDFKCSFITSLQIDRFATILAYSVEAHRTKKGVHRGYAHTSGYNRGRTRRYARMLFNNQFLHGVAAQDAVGIDAGREVVDDSVAAARNGQLAYHAALHVVDSEV